jgi:hypothetical protein
VDDELLCAIRTESSLAVQYWWGVNFATVTRWRKAFGVGQWQPEGSRRLHKAASEAAAAMTRGKKWPEAVIARRRATRAAWGYPPPKRWAQNGWTPE